MTTLVPLIFCILQRPFLGLDQKQQKWTNSSSCVCISGFVRQSLLAKMSDSQNEHALLQVDDATLQRLRTELLDQNEQMAKRIRTVFTLRNIGGTQVVSILKDGMQY